MLNSLLFEQLDQTQTKPNHDLHSTAEKICSRVLKPYMNLVRLLLNSVHQNSVLKPSLQYRLPESRMKNNWT